jgi:hypothetical protein
MKIKAPDPVMTRAEIQAALDRLDRNLPSYEDFSPEKFDALARKARLLRLRLTATDQPHE